MATNASKPSEAASKESLELQKLDLECQVLRAELANATTPQGFLAWISKHSTVLTMIGGIIVFVVSAQRYNDEQEASREAANTRYWTERRERAIAANREQDNRDKEFMHPLWEKQLDLYFEASAIVATIATTDDPDERAAAIKRFWVLYEGPLCIVEPREVTAGMKAFGTAINENRYEDMRDLSKALASAFQSAITDGSQIRLRYFSDGKFDYRR